MDTVNVHEAKAHLSRLIEKAAAGEPFLIAKAGKPMVKVTAVEAPVAKKRIGFLEGMFSVPDDFDGMYAKEIRGIFEGGE